MPQRGFESTEGLIRKVITKQSASLSKAVLEAIMNSVDANASSVSVQIEEDHISIEDDGDSMTKSDIVTYFEQFGLDDQDIEDKDFGKFRMGRGQIFNFGVNVWRALEHYMVISINDDQVEVELPQCTSPDDDAILSEDNGQYTVNTEGLNYALLDAEPLDHSGLSIDIDLYNNVESVAEIAQKVKGFIRYIPFLHDIEVEINGDVVDENPDEVTETDSAYFVNPRDDVYNSQSAVYNIGAWVDKFRLGPVKWDIVTKHDMDLTLDRTSILQDDEVWGSVKSEYVDVTADHLLDSDRVSKSEGVWLLEQLSNDPTLIDKIVDEPIIKDIENNYHTIGSITNSSLVFAEHSSQAESLMSRTDNIVLPPQYEEPLKDVVETVSEVAAEIKEFVDAVSDEMKFEMNEKDVSSLSKRRQTNYRRIRRALNDLGFRGEVRVGYSNHRDMWKDDEDTVYIHKDMLNKKKQVIATEVLQRALKSVAHDGDSRGEFNDAGYTFRNNLCRFFDGTMSMSDCDYSKAQRKILNGDYD